MKNCIHTVIVSLLMAGCTTATPFLNTPSGKAEIIIHTGDISRIKAAIVSEMVNRGYTVQSDSTYQLEMTKDLPLGAGNTSASLKTWSVQNTRHETFILVPTPDGTRVILSGLLQGKATNTGFPITDSAGYSAPLNRKKDVEADQSLLQLIKNRVETQSR